MSLFRTFVVRNENIKRAVFGFIEANWQAMARQEKPIQVLVSEYKAKRSAIQNNRYWAILGEIAENAWVDGKQYPAETWHEEFARRYIGCNELPGGGLVAISTTTLDVAAFAAYMNKVEAYAASELDIQFTL